MPNWRFWIIDGPAKVIEVLFKFYVVVVAALSTVAFLMALLTVILWLFGARWDQYPPK